MKIDGPWNEKNSGSLGTQSRTDWLIHPSNVLLARFLTTLWFFWLQRLFCWTSRILMRIFGTLLGFLWMKLNTIFLIFNKFVAYHNNNSCSVFSYNLIAQNGTKHTANYIQCVNAYLKLSRVTTVCKTYMTIFFYILPKYTNYKP